MLELLHSTADPGREEKRGQEPAGEPQHQTEADDVHDLLVLAFIPVGAFRQETILPGLHGEELLAQGVHEGRALAQGVSRGFDGRGPRGGGVTNAGERVKLLLAKGGDLVHPCGLDRVILDQPCQVCQVIGEGLDRVLVGVQKCLLPGQEVSAYPVRCVQKNDQCLLDVGADLVCVRDPMFRLLILAFADEVQERARQKCGERNGDNHQAFGPKG